MAKPKLRFPEFTDEWEEIKLENAVIFLDGKRKPLEKGERKAGVYPYYGASGIIDYVNDYIFDEELVLLSEDGANIVDRNYRVCFLAKGKYWVNNHAHVLKTKEGYINYFICESLERLDYKKYNTGTAQPKLNQDTCRKIHLLIPTLQEQQKIADFLSSVDDVIQLQEQEITALEEQKKGIMQKLFNREVRFKADNGSEYPEWEKKRIDEVCQIVGGGTPSTSNAEFWNGDIQWFTPTEVGKSKYVYVSERSITEKGIQSSSAKLLPKGTILLSTRATIGEMSIAGQECCTNQGFQSLIVNGDCSNEYIYYLQDTIKAYALKNSSGSTFLEISKNNLGKCILPIPCIKEQEKIVGCLSAYDEAIQIRKDKLEVWKEIKKGLLQQMFV